MRELKFEGVAFNVDCNLKYSKREFVKRSLDNGLWKNSPHQKKLIEEAWQQLQYFKPKKQKEPE